MKTKQLNKFSLIFITLSLITFQNLYSQIDYFPGFVVFESGDTIHGEIRDINEIVNCQTIYFKYPTDKEVKFKTKKVKSYVRGYDAYTKKRFTGSPIPGMAFMKIIQMGEATLFEHSYSRNMGGSASSMSYHDVSYYIEKGDEFRKIPIGTFRKVMVELFSDEEVIHKRLMAREYNYDDIEDVVYDYNKCKKN